MESVIDTGYAGIFRFTGMDTGARNAVLQQVGVRYSGPPFDGFDLLHDHEEECTWCFLGNWTDCATDDAVQQAAREVEVIIDEQLEMLRAGLSQNASGMRVLTSTSCERASSTALNYYILESVLPDDKEARHQRLKMLEATRTDLPEWKGAPMGVPHWVGYGLEVDDESIYAFSPYLRLDVLDDVLHISGVTTDDVFDAWLHAAASALPWLVA